ncbi:MAG: hypothetical protein ABFD08_02620 [Syntrophomonas sp.]
MIKVGLRIGEIMKRSVIDFVFKLFMQALENIEPEIQADIDDMYSNCDPDYLAELYADVKQKVKELACVLGHCPGEKDCNVLWGESCSPMKAISGVNK